MRALVAEQWMLEIRTPPADRKGWFADWMARRPADASGHIGCSYAALHYLADSGYRFDTVWEAFAGVGAQGLAVRHLFAPAAHCLHDFHPAAAAHLETVFDQPGEHVHHGDSYGDGFHAGADLVVLDFGDLTAHRAVNDPRHRGLLDRVFAETPRAVLLTDIAGPRLHLHTARYARALGRDVTRDYRTYLAAFGRWFDATYDYRPLVTVEHRWSAVMALVPAADTTVPGPILPLPERPEGLRFVD